MWLDQWCVVLAARPEVSVCLPITCISIIFELGGKERG